MPSTISYDIILKPGTEVQDCKIFSAAMGAPEDCSGKLDNHNPGELQYNAKKNIALFSSPSFAACKQSENPSKCSVTLTLTSDTLTKLQKGDPGLTDYINATKKSFAEHTQLPSSSIAIPTGAAYSPSGIPPYLIIILPIVLVIFIVCTMPVRGLWWPPNTQKRRHRKAGSERNESSQPDPLDHITVVSPRKNIPVDVEKRLQALSDRLGKLETRFMNLEQDVKSPSKILQTIKPQAGYFYNSAQRDSSVQSDAISRPLSSPPTLTIELIKKAVETCSYPLILQYSHEFLSETEESRQGLEDPKKFLIEGDQTQSAVRAQSEFIAIPCDGSIYLIPNILPNASRPASTMKRHADRNNIYRLGQGSDLLKIQDLATVQKTGNKYELLFTGQLQ